MLERMSHVWRPEGLIPLLQSPFFDDGGFDEASLRRQVRFVLGAGVTTMAYPGFVSEWWKLTEAELFDAASIIREETRGKAKVIFNVTAQFTRLAVAQAQAFQKLGADGLMCLPPFAVPPGPAAVLAHLSAVLEATPLPHVLQYSASLTGLQLSPDELAELHRRFPHFCSIKIDYVPPGPMVSRLAAAMPPGEFTFLIGYAGLQLADSLARGAHGLMGGAGHAEEDKTVFDALRRSPDSGLGLFHQLLPLINMEMQTIEYSIALHKRMLFEKGVITSPHVRQPGYELDAAAIAEMRGHMIRTASLRGAGAAA
jgi:4-hydroxy-tetrahydrodipicolinate synthase